MSNALAILLIMSDIDVVFFENFIRQNFQQTDTLPDKTLTTADLVELISDSTGRFISAMDLDALLKNIGFQYRNVPGYLDKMWLVEACKNS